MVYPKSFEWVIETSYGVYTDRGWEYAASVPSLEDGLSRINSWELGIYRLYNNHTGEIVEQSAREQGQN